MSEISNELPPPPPTTDPELARWLQENVGRLQRHVYQIRQFLEPAIKLNEGAPAQEFNPLE